jgi:hypothetical protein
MEANTFSPSSTRRQNQHHVGQPHHIAHAFHRGTLQCKSIGVGGMGITRRAAEAEHRIFFFRLKERAAQQCGVFVGLEVAHTHDAGLWIDRCGKGGNAFGQGLNEEVRGTLVGRAEGGDLAASRIVHLLRVFDRHRMHLDVFADNKLHARQADAIHGQRREAEGLVWIAEIHHDGRLGMGQLAKVGPLNLKVQSAFIDVSGFTFGATDGNFLAILEHLGPAVGSDDGRNAELARKNCGVAGASATVGDNGRCGLHDRLPVRCGSVTHQHLSRLKVAEVLDIFDDMHPSGADSSADRPTLKQDLGPFFEVVDFENGTFLLRRYRLRPRLHNI